MLKVFILLCLTILASSQICLNTNWKVNGLKKTDLLCSTGATVASAQVTGLPQTCNAGSVHTATIQITLQPPSGDRYDIGYYLALNGGNALNGYDCFSGYLNPVAAVGKLAKPASGVGPYANLDVDGCGDMSRHGGKVVTSTTEISFLCQDTDGDNLVNMDYCFSWKLNVGNIACSSHLQAYPAYPTQCQCGNLNIANIQVLPRCELGELIPIASPETYYNLPASTAIPNYLMILGSLTLTYPGTTTTFNFGEWSHVRVLYVDLKAFNDGGSLYVVNTCNWNSETRMIGWEMPADVVDAPTCIPEGAEYIEGKPSEPWDPCLNNSWMLELTTTGSGKYIIWMFSKAAELSAGDQFSITCMW